jgi:pimeloyl-ACP methyl ester carboxylesterase
MALPCLIILPGLDGTGKLHDEFRKALGSALSCRTIAYPREQPLGYVELAALIRTQLPLEPYVLLAESFAGPLAILLAAQAPAGLKGLIFCASFARNPRPFLRWARPLAGRLSIKTLPRWLRAPLLWGSMSDRRVPTQTQRAVASVADAVLRRRILEVLTVDESAALPSIAHKTLLLEAAHDRIVPRAATRLLAKGLVNASVERIDGPHLLLQSRPAACAAAVLGFLGALSLAQEKGSAPA